MSLACAAEPLVFRPYEDGDERSIAGLFEAAFGRTLSEDRWKWRFRDGPFGPSLVELAWHGDVLVGHYAAARTSVLLRGIPMKTGVIGTAMVHPDFWGRRILREMAARLHSRAAEEGYDFLWTFPPRGRHTHRLFTRDLGFVDIHEIPTFSLRLQDNRLNSVIGGNVHVKRVAEFDARFDRLWTRTQSRYAVIAKRDSRYLNWRFSLNSSAQYLTFGYASGSELLGYEVLKYYGPDLQIVDLLTGPESGVGTSLVAHALQVARAEELESVSMWLNPSDPVHLELERLGFQPCAPVTYFTARLPAGAAGYHPAGDFRNWHLMMSDSDVY